MKKMKYINIVIMGSQGSGKSTQAQLLAEKFGLKHVSMGEELRKVPKVKNLIDQGFLAPHKDVMAIIEKATKEDGFVVEGFPRELRQAEEFSKRIDKLFFLKLSDEEGIKRIMKGEKVGNKGVQRSNRTDDTPEAVKKRLQIFHSQTEPVLDFYRQKGILAEVDGSGSIDEVFEAILELL